METPPAEVARFTGRRRVRGTRATVRWSDRLARAAITVGGIGTIVAVLGVCVFLVWVAAPLFSPAAIETSASHPLPADPAEAVRLRVDDASRLSWAMFSDGRIVVRRLADGALVDEIPAPEGAAVTALMVDGATASVALGHADGTVRIGDVRFVTEFLDDAAAPPELVDATVGETLVHDRALVTRTPEGQLRADRVRLARDEAFAVGTDRPIVAIDWVETVVGPRLVTLSESGELSLLSITRKTNLLTGAVRSSASRWDLPFSPGGDGLPAHLLLSQLGDQLFVAWRSGRLQRWDLRNPSDARVVEETMLVAEGSELTALELLLGRTTLVAGDSAGAVSAWFGVKPSDAPTSDGIVLRRAHLLDDAGAPVRAFGISSRSRLLAVGRTDGSVTLYQVTAENALVEARVAGGAEIETIGISPREDLVVAITQDSVSTWQVDLGHPEATPATLFTKVWYEGYAKPEHVWQSSSGSDAFEPKLGFVPLVFGTLKATFYSLLFGVPIALLAAIFSAEMLSSRTRARVKPAIELMASLPSVVLGFLAALVLAPVVEDVVPAILVAFFSVPGAFALGAFLWQAAPRRFTQRWQRRRPLFMALALPLGLALALLAGPRVESLLFAGDVKRWLDGGAGSATGGWLLFTLPICIAMTVVASTRLLHPRVVRATVGWSHRRFAVFELVRFAVLGIATLAAAWGASALLSAAGLDPRGVLIDTYVQRNALVVGFVMGFAIIPIIYTIAEDALSSVPAHLRAASLGAGATPWQTAMRVIVPTAASGLFSAVMIGLGRAVGETMIVLMAAGNTPVLELNPFNGFRTLAANIAVELPEAVRGGTHYRTLYLAALVLFAMTFVVNALAEVVRQRFRKRAFQL